MFGAIFSTQGYGGPIILVIFGATSLATRGSSALLLAAVRRIRMAGHQALAVARLATTVGLYARLSLGRPRGFARFAEAVCRVTVLFLAPVG